MHWALFLALNVVAPVKVATPGLTYVGIDAQLGGVYVDRFVSLLQEAGPIRVTTPRDLEQVLGLERQRQLLGCDASAACLAELSGALGVDAVLGGSLAKTASGLLVTLRVVRANDGSEVTTSSGRFKDEAALGDWFEAQAPLMAKRLLLAFGRVEDPTTPTAVATPPGPSQPIVRWLPAAGGGVAIVAGSLVWLAAGTNAALLKREDLSGVTTKELQDAASAGRVQQIAGPVLIVVGVAGVAASLAWMRQPLPSAAPAVAVVPVRGGAVAVVGGSF